MSTRFENVIHVYMHTEVAYVYIQGISTPAHTVNTVYELAMKSSSPVTAPF